MVQISGTGAVKRRLQRLAGKGVKANVSVSYKAEYAVYVHENLEAYHPIGQAKFLEQPARELRPALVRGIKDDLKAGATLLQALYRAGLKLQAASQELCPIDTGFLRNSATTGVTTE